MAAPYRCTVTIDGTKFDAVSTSIKFGTETDNTGTAKMGSLTTEIRVWADFHDDKNLPFGSIKKFFDLANVVTRDKIKDMKIEFWKDDSHQDALCSYAFSGWLSRFELSNPVEGLPDLGPQDDIKRLQGLAPKLNHMLVLDLEVVLNQEKFKDIKMSN